jgi:hypothetical protein
MMSQELNNAAEPQAPAQSAPQPEPTPSTTPVSQQPEFAPQQSSTFTVPTTPPGSVFAQPGELHGAANITFEETPLPPAGAPQTPGTPSNGSVL